ncbi:Sec14p phosphatidylinositol transfer family protein [Trifolium repens]|nr:Sec14p phosphatidylinositol transfer family protein [Trifolium repens]
MFILIFVWVLLCSFLILFFIYVLDLPKDESIIVAAFPQSLIVEDLLPEKHDEYHTMLSFFKAKKFDIEKTKKMWVDMLQWRKEFGIDTIMEDFEFKELNEFVKYQPHCYHGVDKEGRPVFIVSPKKDFQKEPFITTTRERCLDYLRQECEKLFAIKFPACTIASKSLIDLTTQIIDVQDIDDEVQRFDWLVDNIYNDNYAMIHGQTFIINASIKFILRWNTVKYNLDRERASKVHVLGNNYQTKLLEIINASELPTYLGGTCTCADQGGCLRSGKGPWKNPEILKMIHSGEASQISQPVKVLNNEEKVEGIDTSTAESRSEAEEGNDIAKAVKGYSHLSLTPVRDENPNNWLDPSDMVMSPTENRMSVLEKLVDEQGKLLTELNTNMGQIKEFLLEFKKKTPPSESTENLVKNAKTEGDGAEFVLVNSN